MQVTQDQLGKKWKCSQCAQPLLVTFDNVEPYHAAAGRTASADPSSGSAVPLEWQEGDIYLDLYEVVEYLGRGGMGKVHRVHHLGWDIDLAVKSPRPELLQQAGGAENFERECETWISLGLHPHIVSCYYVRLLGGIPRIFAEYVPGGNLFDWIRSKRLYEGGPERALALILQIGIQTSWGLHYAHEQGLIHRDVKPGNVMLTNDATAKVTDFGLAKVQADANKGFGTASRESGPNARRMGMTRAYCSPEQYAQQDVTRKTDIWSWGLMILHMFTGRVTWQIGTEALQALEAILKADQGANTGVKIPGGVVELLRYCFHPNEVSRPDTMTEVGTILEKVYATALRRKFPLTPPVLVAAQAEGLNNRAVSLLDLGKEHDAKPLWEEALKAAPNHPESTFNLGLIDWRAGRMTDAALLDKLREVAMLHPSDFLPPRLIAEVHFERGDCVTAAQTLKALRESAPHDQAAGALLQALNPYLANSRRAERVLKGHMDVVTSVALSRKGRAALSGSEDNTLILWDVATGERVRVLEGHTGSVEAVCLTADSRLAVSASRDRTLRIWALETGECQHVIENTRAGFQTVAALPKNGDLLLAGADNTVLVYEAKTGTILHTCEGHEGPITDAQPSPHGHFACSASEDGTLRFWDISTGDCTRVFAGHTASVTSVAFSRNGRYLLSSSEDTMLKLWDVDSGHCLSTLGGHPEGVLAAALCPDGRHVLSGARDNTVRLWDLTTQRCVCTCQNHTAPVTSVSFNKDGQWGLSGSRDKTVILWRLSTGAEFPPAPLVLCRALRTEALISSEMAFKEAVESARGLLSNSNDIEALHVIREIRARQGFQRRAEALALWFQLYVRLPKTALNGAWQSAVLRGHTGPVEAVCFNNNGTIALTGSGDSTLRSWDVATGHCLATFEGHTGAVNAVCLSRDGLCAVSGSEDTAVKLWDTKTGSCLRTFHGHTGTVESVGLSCDGHYVISGGWDIRLWHLATGRCLLTLEGHTADVTAVNWSGDGRFIISGSSDETVKLWEVASGRCLRTLRGQGEVVRSVAVSPDGRFAVSGGGSLWGKPGNVKLWDIASARCMRTFQGHTNTVNSVCFSEDGRFVLSGGRDGALRLWDTSSGKCIRTLKAHGKSVERATLSRDGRYAASASEDGTAKIWVLDWELEEVEESRWDKQASAYLLCFLACHTPYAGTVPEQEVPTTGQIKQALTRRGKPVWTDEDFGQLLYTLGCAGFGHLDPEEVRRTLHKLASKYHRFSFLSKKIGS